MMKNKAQVSASEFFESVHPSVVDLEDGAEKSRMKMSTFDDLMMPIEEYD